MSKSEIDFFGSRLKGVRNYFEFGAGGSTVFALEHSLATVSSIEADGAWIEKLREHKTVSEAIESGRLQLQHVDIGPVGPWSTPLDPSSSSTWWRYYVGGWSARDAEFDFVLIDGRFRVACAMAALKFTNPSALIAVHDYRSRRQLYGAIENHYMIVDETGDLSLFSRKPVIDERSWLRDFAESTHKVD